MRKRLSMMLAFILTIGVIGGNLGAARASAAEAIPNPDPVISVSANECSINEVSRTPVFTLTFSQPMKLVDESGNAAIKLIDETSQSSDNIVIPMTAGNPGQKVYQIPVDYKKPLEYNHSYIVRVDQGAFEVEADPSVQNSLKELSFKTIKQGVQSYEPAAHSTSINPNLKQLEITFNEKMKTGTGEVKVVLQSNTNTVIEIIPAGSITINNCQATIPLTKPLAMGTSYAVIIDGAVFVTETGASFKGIQAAEWNFTTYGSTAIQTTYPANNGILSGSQVILYYNQPVRAGSGTIDLYRSNGTNITRLDAASSLVKGSGTAQITVDFSAYLQANTDYYVLVNSNAFKDQWGNPVQGITSNNGLRFSTAMDSSSLLTISNLYPSNQQTGVAIDSDLYISFNRAVERGNGEVSVRKSGSSYNVPVTVTPSGREVRIRLDSGYTYDYDSTYYVTIGRNAFYDAQNYNIQYAGLSGSWSFQTPVTDKQPPVIQSSDMYNNTTIRLAYNKQLYSDYWLQTSSFSVTVNEEARRISNVYTSGDSVYVVLDTGVAVGQNVKISYTAGTRPIQDLYRNSAASFSQREVLNGIDTALPKPSSGTASYSNITLYYNQPLKGVSSSAYEQFTVKGDGTTYGIKSISQSGQTIYLTLSSPISDGQVVKLSYKPGKEPIQDSRGQNISAFTDFILRNLQDSKAPIFQSATGTGSKVTLTYNELLSTSNIPMKSQFSVLVNGVPNYVNTVEVKDTQVNLTLASPLNNIGNSKVTVSYVPGTTRLTDLNGNAAGYVNLEPVKITESNVNSEIKSITIQGDTLQITYNKTLMAQSYLSTEQFQVYVDSVQRGVLQAFIGGDMVTLKLTSAVTSGQKVDVSYLPGVYGISDTYGTKMTYFSRLSASEGAAGSKDLNLPEYLSLTDLKDFGISTFMLNEKAVSSSLSINSRNNQTMKQLFIDSDKLRDAFGYIVNSKQSTHMLLINAPADNSSVTASISLSTLENVYAKDKQASIAVKAGEAMIVLPLSQINIAEISRTLQTGSGNIKLNLAVDKLSAESFALLNDKLNAAAIQKLTDPYDFYVSAVDSNAVSRTTELKVNNQYLILNHSTMTADRMGMYRWDVGADKMTFVPGTVDSNGDIQVIRGKAKGNHLVIGGMAYKYYNDTNNHWAKVPIINLASRFIVDGRTTNTFAPNKNITRAEFAEYVARGLGLPGDVQTSQRFYDVTNIKENAFIGAAVKAGIIAGNTDGSFKPDSPITREQMAIIMARAMNYTGFKTDLNYSAATYLKKFKDYKQIQSPDSAARLLKEGIIQGVTPTTFQPKGYATRAQAAVMLERLLKKVGYL
ncbi:SwmB domain-containing protein [Paenibacillus sp. SAF-054]|uniref:SwmB domain-containing protein n=1 Tax=unclassified Paenibacillus TaxID=185978 RepID=UPI003F7E4F68